ncbi:hypothetical protein Cgig2_025128 [Carnegiea gigantea]|uniref:Uncharacterized protein n=1 Tax=Carnegiea gigantea TaxID=171969 RepID=A0A9Q1KR87_9CARY|nr:hypothetical protein Cgig2_025128 [Carnegiea gigantea]
MAESPYKSLLAGEKKPYELPEVHRKLESSTQKCVFYETELLEQLPDVEAAGEFFIHLDDEFNKVNQFYKTTEKELVDRGQLLKQQLNFLSEVRSKLKQSMSNMEDSSLHSMGDSSISSRMSCEETEPEQGQDTMAFEADKDGGKLTETSKIDEMDRSSRRIRKDDSGSRSFSSRVFNCQGKNLRINIPLTTPSCTLSAISHIVWEDLIIQSSKKGSPRGFTINKTRLQHAEKMLKGAFIELYKGLTYLNTYRNLNMLAFVKILKKFDKVTNKEVLPIYLRVVESSYFNTSEKVVRLSDEVEDMFVKHFAKDDKRKAMKYLKPIQRKESHVVTFFIGKFFSSSHPLSPTKELKYRDVFLICAASMTAIIGVLFIHLSLVAKGYSSRLTQAIPGFLLLFFLLLLVCPFNIFYRSSRYRFLQVIRNIVLSPLYKVVMLDFFMADQLCSQVHLLKTLVDVACYYVTGSYKTQDYGYCTRTTQYKDLGYAVSFLPYYWRAMQCARRWFDEGDVDHLVNLGKYVSAMLAAGAKLAYEKEHTTGYLCLLVALSSSATVYQLYWDYVKDWGLLQFHSKNPWLRDELMLRHKCIYYFSMVLNLILRLAWLQTVLRLNSRVATLFFAALEVIRRGHWNFYRLENEHISNVGKFRAVKQVPLPFHEVGEEED